MATLLQDLRYALRTLARSPGYALVTVLTLALGIGANTAIFSVVNGVLLRPLPYERGDRLVVLHQPGALAGATDAGFSPLEVADYRQQSRALTGVVEYHSMSFNLLGRGEPLRVQTGVVSANFFDVLGVKPLLGRTFRPGEDQPGATPVLVLSYAFWMNRLGGDPAIVGARFEMTDRIHTVVGVLPPIPQYPNENDVFMPISSCPFRAAPAWADDRTVRGLTVFGRLASGRSVEHARHDLASIARRLRAEYPQAYPQTQGLTVTGEALLDDLTREARPTLLILLATAGFVLLIACANVANLTLVRLVRRQREMALRAALGAGRGRLVRQLLTESTLLAVVGAAVGLLVARASVALLAALAARFTTRAAEIDMDGRVLAFTLVVSVFTGLAVGAIPLLSSTRNLAGSLRAHGGSAGEAPRRVRVESVLVVSQVAVSLVLLFAAGLMLRSVLALQRVDAGFDPQNVLTMRVTLSRDDYTTPESRRSFATRLLARVDGEPGVVSSAMAGTYPLNEGQPFTVSFRVEGRDVGDDEALPRAEPRFVSPGYFRTIGAPLLRGRTFTGADHADAPRVAVVNQSMARHTWGAEDPVGKRITFDDGETWTTVVGVVGDVKQWGLDREAADEVYGPIDQSPLLGGNLLIRTAADPTRMIRSARELVREIDPNAPVDKVRTLAQVREESMAAPRLTTTLLGLFAALALVLAGTGIGGVVAFSVSRRTQEFGIRMALGARRADVLRMVLWQGMALALVGLAIGAGAALAMSRFMAGLVFGVEAGDPVTLAAVSLALAAVAVAACLAPARRTTAIDPMRVLRSD
jgi:predicted permease